MKYSKIIIGAIVLTIGISSFVLFQSRQNNEGIRTDETMQTNTKKNVLSRNISKYQEFNQDEYEKAVKEDNLIVLNFYASWCPICRAESPIWINTFNNLNTDNISGFRVNYNDPDTDQYEKDLAKKFGVTYQHTKVFLKNGEIVLKVTEQWDEKTLLEKIQEFNK